MPKLVKPYPMKTMSNSGDFIDLCSMLCSSDSSKSFMTSVFPRSWDGDTASLSLKSVDIVQS
jgi:hypothetical protein